MNTRCGWIGAVAVGLVWVWALAAAAQSVRPAVWSGRFYPADPAELTELIDELTRRAGQTPLQIPTGSPLRALVMPHAGYIYSGWTAAHVARVLHPGQFSKLVVMGPDHRVGLAGGAVSAVDAYETPLGTVALHPDAAGLRQSSELFRSVPASDQTEHSLEVLLPFLQRYLGDFRLLPLVLGSGDIAAMTAAVAATLDDSTLLVVSSDLSHYLPYDQARQEDRRTVESLLACRSQRLTGGANVACGRVPLRVLLRLARQYGWQPVLLHYSNSGDTAGSRNRVVGYASIAFFGGLSMSVSEAPIPVLTPEQGKALLRLARQTIGRKLGQYIDPTEATQLDVQLDDPALQTRRGTFVTLSIAGQLRGCIGSLSGDEPLAKGIRRNALNAAFHDFRFSPLTVADFDRIDIEVSILSEPRPLTYADADDLVSRLRPGVDGVILQDRGRSATFLPQVWEQLPRTEDFLSHLCSKAGLPADHWRHAHLDVQTYQVTYFEEHP